MRHYTDEDDCRGDYLYEQAKESKLIANEFRPPVKAQPREDLALKARALRDAIEAFNGADLEAWQHEDLAHLALQADKLLQAIEAGKAA